MKSSIFNSNKTFIVAEIGNNHEGSFKIASEMIEAASNAGVDAVKFQTINPNNFVTSTDINRIRQLSKFKLSNEEFIKLANQANDLGVLFFSTPFDLESAKFLNNIQPIFKISSGDNNFVQLINTVFNFNKPTIISTGISEIEVIDRIYKEWLEGNFKSEIAFLHCVSSYPVPLKEANLGAINFLNKRYEKAKIGYSDHTIGIEAACAAVASGAKIIEKHFTLDKNFSDFRDHSLSADPKEMKELVEKIRLINEMFSLDVKNIQKCEEKSIISMKRSIAAAQDLDANSKIAFEHLTWLRPATGLPPGEEEVFLGKVLKKNILKGEILSLDMFYD